MTLEEWDNSLTDKVRRMKMLVFCEERNFVAEYERSEKNQTLNMEEYGLLEIGALLWLYKRKLITKAHYHKTCRQVEKQLFRI